MRYIRELFRTIIQIIEIKQDFEVNRVTYCFVMLLFYLQVTGYIFYSSDTKPISEEKIKSVQLILGNTVFFWPTSEFGSYSLPEVTFYCVEGFLFLLFLYMVILTALRMYCEKDCYQVIATYLLPFNRFLNVFLIFFYWVFLIPCMDITCGMLICSDFTYIMYFQNNCVDYPQQFVGIGAAGFVVLNFFGLSISALYRNYEFNERELMKRKLSLVSITQYVFITLMIFMFWARMGMNWAIITAVGAMVCQIYQIGFQFPFRDKFLMQFFSIMGSIFCSGTILTTIWAKVQNYSDTEFFYSLFLATSVFAGAAIISANKKYEDVLCLNTQNFESLYGYLDVYLEEVFKLTEEQQKNDRSKCTLMKVLILHQEYCSNDVCECKRSTFKDEKGLIESEQVYSLIENIFAWSLNQKVLQNDRSEFENISLKYISFLVKYRNNPAKALYELKILAMKQQNVSFYFLTIAEILTGRIEEALKHVQIFNSKLLNQHSNHDDDSYSISVDKIIVHEQQIETVSRFIQSYAKSRINFWDKFMKKSSLSTHQLYQECIRVASTGTSADEMAQKTFSSNQSQWKQSAKMIKLLSLFKSVVCNEMHVSALLESKYQEIMQIDQYKDQSFITNLNFLKGNIVWLTISLSKEKGRILNKLNERFMKFFEYEKEDIGRIKSVNQLMPPFISSIHGFLVDNYLSNGFSKHMDTPFLSFALSKHGFLMPTNIYINSAQLIPNDYTLNAVFVNLNTRKDYIVTQPSGLIAGISQQAYQYIFSNAMPNHPVAPTTAQMFPSLTKLVVLHFAL